MCVAIAMEPNTELSLDEVFKMGRSNADGIGVAWAEDGQVHWYKSINYTPQSAQKFIAERSGFFRLVHFRLSTVGGVQVNLCHPFEVGPLANSGQQGHSSKVLIHNGHWYRYRDILDILDKEDALPDKGPWSDSRLMAYLAHFDEDWLDVVTGKVAMMNGQGDIKLLGSWDTLRPGIKVSNKIWDHSFNYRRSGRDRDWPGWGWTAEQWEAKEKHEQELAEKAEAEKKAKDEQEKQSEKASSTQGKAHAIPEFKYTHTPAEIRVGGAPGDSGVVGSRAGSRGETGGRALLGGSGDAGPSGHRRYHINIGQGIGISEGSPTYKWENGKQVIETAGEFIANGQVKVEVKSNEIKYDHTPWHNQTNGKWYWIPPGSVTGAKYRVEEIDERKARAIVESVTSPVHGSERR